MWSPELVRSRFIEAADTERYLPLDRLNNGKGYWPQHCYEPEDLAGWDDVAKRDHEFRPASRAPRGAVSRHEECITWSQTYLSGEHEKVRPLVWGFAFCRAYEREFSALCNRKGWAKSTAYSRLERAWMRLSELFHTEGAPVRFPAEKWLDATPPEMAGIQISFAGSVRIGDTAIPHAPYRSEKSRDMICSAEDAERFSEFLEERNDRLRKSQRIKLVRGVS